MGLFDKSSSSNTTNLTEETVTETQQQDQSGNSGLNFANTTGNLGLSFSSNETLNASDSHDIFSTSTDQGAVGAGRDIALGALDASSSLGNTALSTLAKQNADSLSLISGLVDKTLDNSKTLTRDASANDQSFLSQALEGFQGLAVQNSQSADDRITKLVAYGLVALVLIVVAPAIFKSGAKAVIA